MKPKVSVCIPVYNAAGFLESCLTSVVAQTLSDIEIICVEDASTDNSDKLLREYAGKDSRIRIIRHEKNMGLVKTRKDAVLSAQGKYIMFLDSDDELYPNACEKACEAIERSQTDAVQFGVQNVDAQDNFKKLERYQLVDDLERIEDTNWLYLYDKGVIKSWEIWNKIYKTELCKKAYMQMEDDCLTMAEDTYYFYIFGYFAKSFSIIKDVLYKHRLGYGLWSGITDRINLEKYKILLSEKKSLDAIIRFYETKPDAKEYGPFIRKYVKEIFLRRSVIWWHNRLQDKDKAEGLNVLKEVWGEENLSFALVCLSDNVSARMLKLNKDNARLQKEKQSLQKEKQNLQNEKRRLQKELTVIKESGGFKVLKQYYHVRDAVKNGFGVFSSRQETEPYAAIPPAKRITTLDKKVTLINYWTDDPAVANKDWLYLFVKNNTKLKHLNIFTIFGKKEYVEKYATKKDVFFSGENLDVKHGLYDEYCDYCLDHVGLSLGFGKRSEANYLRLPLWMMWIFDPVVDKDRIAERVRFINQARNSGKYECSVIARHDNWNMRTPIYEALKDKLNILCAGKWNNNTNVLWNVYGDNKIKFLNDCKFTICAENEDTPWYVTEKLFEAFLGGCIPIYAGANARPEPDIVNLNSVLLWERGNKENNEDIIRRVCELNRDEKLYAEFLAQTKLMPAAVDYVYDTFASLKARLSELR